MAKGFQRLIFSANRRIISSWSAVARSSVLSILSIMVFLIWAGSIYLPLSIPFRCISYRLVLYLTCIYLSPAQEANRSNRSSPAPVYGMTGRLDHGNMLSSRPELRNSRKRSSPITCETMPFTRETNISEMIKLYSSCISCPKIAQICKGPNFFAMPLSEIIDWMIARKNYLGWTQERLSLESGVPAGTIARVLSRKITDVKFETLSPLLRALTGSDGAELPCPDPDDSATEQLRSRVAHLEQELADTRAMADRSAQRDADTIQVLKDQSSFRRRSIVGLASALAIVSLALVTLLIVDYANPDLGFFWRDYSLSITGIYDALRNVFSA